MDVIEKDGILEAGRVRIPEPVEIALIDTRPLRARNCDDRM
jgi:hypothetical protein